MKSIRYILLALLLAPGAALAQVVGDTNATLEIAGNEYAVIATQNFGAQFVSEVPFGPNKIVQAIDAEGDGTTIDGCEPFENPDDIAGNIALISRGACAFVVKAENAANAGAVAFIVYMDEREGQEGEGLVNMAGDCDPAVCTAPGVFMSRRDYKSILPDVKFEEEATITAVLPEAPSTGSVATGVVNLPIYDDGFFGTNFSFGPSFDEAPYTFNGFTPLFVGTVLAGVDGNVLGSPYGGASEYERNGTVLTGTVNEGRDPAAQASFANADAGISVTNLAFATPTGAGVDDTHIILQLTASSTTGADIPGVYLGLFADWDIVDDADDTSTNDSGGWNGEFNLAYVFDTEMAQYHGVMAVVDETAFPGSTLSGYTTDSDGSDENMFTALTSNVPPADGEAERAVVVGQGPYMLPADGTGVIQVFALVAGATEADLFDSARGVCARFGLACGGVATEEETLAGTYRLESAFPNPFSATTQIGFSIPQTEEVSIVVYDMLGREVATLANAAYPAGVHQVTLDAANLPSGVYVYRMTAGQTTLTERVTVVR
ncbi:MAG: PA domain-containing protein [Bacteroidota bacterium]